MRQEYSLNLPLNTILQGHVVEQLKKLPDKSVNCIVTSPPYWALRAYKTTPVIWDEDANCEHIWQPRGFKLHSGRGDAQKSGKYSEQKPVADTELNDATCQKCGAWSGELGLERDFNSYIRHLADVFDECKRVLRDDGTLWIVMGDTYARSGMPDYPDKSLCMIPSRFAIEMVNRGWTLRNEILWFKPNCIPSSAKDRFTVDFEKVFFFTKGSKYFFETQYEPYQTSIEDAINKNKYQRDGGNKHSTVTYPGFDKTRTSKYVEKLMKYANSNYEGQATKDYDSAKAQNPSDTKRRILESMKKRMPPIGGVKKAGGDNPTYSGNTPDWGVFGRIKRTVWKINTAGFSGGHFAVFPPALIQTPIKAGCPTYICSKCGKPASTKYREWRENTRPGNDVGKMKSGTQADPNKELHKSDLSKFRQQIYRVPDGMQSCDCNAPMSKGVILDPFIGTGTTGEVALKQGKSFIGIELNGDYIKLAEKRLAPLLDALK